MFTNARSLTCTFAAVGMALGASLASAESGPESTAVDLELVLATDRSASMSRLMLVKQRNGFAEAFRNEELHKIVKAGPLGRIAVVYFEWSDETDQEVVVPWTLLESREDFERFANAVKDIPIAHPNRETAIGAALLKSQKLLNTNLFSGGRQVIDISGNGRNSAGPAISEVLQKLNSIKTTVNGLVLPRDDPPDDIDASLTEYFWREVVFGPGGFAITVLPDAGFSEAIYRKLALEVAWISE